MCNLSCYPTIPKFFNILMYIRVYMYICVFSVESLFGSPPFASKTFEELEKKLLDTKPVEVHKLFTSSVNF